MQKEPVCAKCKQATLPLIPATIPMVADIILCTKCASVPDSYNLDVPVNREPSVLPFVKMTPAPDTTFEAMSKVSGKNAYLIYTDGTIMHLHFDVSVTCISDQAVDNQLELLQKIALGNIQTLPLSRDSSVTLIVNENGQNQGLPYNSLASRFKRYFMEEEDYQSINYGNLVGNVLVMPFDLLW